MPVDVDAEVLDNTRLSADYNVVALAAPEIASLTAPGQFVMVKPGTRHDPLLRRPFSVFEILRDRGRRPIGVSLLNKRVGIGTRLLYELRPGDRLPCLGPLGRPFRPVAPPAEAWMVAGGVGLGPFVTLAEALPEQGTRNHALLRRPDRARSSPYRAVRGARRRARPRHRRRLARRPRLRDGTARTGASRTRHPPCRCRCTSAVRRR